MTQATATTTIKRPWKLLRVDEGCDPLNSNDVNDGTGRQDLGVT